MSASQMRVAHAALAARGVPLASNQVQYSLLHRKPETNGVRRFMPQFRDSSAKLWPRW